MKSRLLIFLLLSVNNFTVAQDSVVQRIGAQLQYHPYDYFIGARYEREKKRLHHTALLSCGVTRTFFQQRLYPQLGYQFAFDLYDVRRLQTGLLVRVAGTLSHVNKQSDHGFIYSEEALLGCYVGTGRRNRFSLSAGIGPMVEQAWSETRAGFAHYFTWSYFGEISWTHAL
jgi:hypothetical protein